MKNVNYFSFIKVHRLILLCKKNGFFGVAINGIHIGWGGGAPPSVPVPPLKLCEVLQNKRSGTNVTMEATEKALGSGARWSICIDG